MQGRQDDLKGKGFADMSILIGKEMEKALKNGSIRIEPLDRSQVGPGSIDLTLGNDFRVFEKRAKVYHVRTTPASRTSPGASMSRTGASW